MRDIRELLGILLTDAGYVVTTAATGEDALTTLAARPYALVLTDYHLPDMTGADVAVAAKQCLPPPKVLLMSGSPEVEVYAKAMDADAWFQKGDSPVDLLNQVQCLLQETPLLTPSHWPDLQWIMPGNILTGPYPSDSARQQCLLDAGIRLIIDLSTRD
ncbi:MAG TPA: response regulator [Armatimonadota bacterium]|jgi:DNA-binding response OmpR family regulator